MILREQIGHVKRDRNEETASYAPTTGDQQHRHLPSPQPISIPDLKDWIIAMLQYGADVTKLYGAALQEEGFKIDTYNDPPT
jgi:hypothetical protein